MVVSPGEMREKLVMKKVRARGRTGWYPGKNSTKFRERETVIEGIICI
jgi:hypothetical protein